MTAPSHRRGRGQVAYRPPAEPEPFRHARGRAPVRPPIAQTRQMPAIDPRPEVVELRYRPPLRVELALYLSTVMLALVLGVVPWLGLHLWRIERGIESPIVVISPSPTPVE
ncbi:hypothetical protein [Cryptosporangium sp. NPDC051539]|uniref:hypothetical protein n=1 Tax=Cryptosporangium sp. NPDC051539 TaxID=3363962 RepID=UPI0037A1B478